MDEEHVKRFRELACKPLSGRIEHQKNLIRGEYPLIFEAMDSRLTKFFIKEHTSSTSSPSDGEGKGSTSAAASDVVSFPAVDIGSGHGAGTIYLALHFQPPSFPSGKLLWYPTEWNEGKPNDRILDVQTRAALSYLAQEAREKTHVLFIDNNNETVYKNNLVGLHGLKTMQFNGRRGIVRGPDPSAQGRYAVQLSMDHKDQRSFKQENLRYLKEVPPEDASLRFMREQGTEQNLYEDLLERSRELNILKHETWSNFDDLRGKCALVTCSHLLSCLGYRDPTAWQDTMEFASIHLHKGGYLVQLDEVGYAEFGNVEFMQEWVQQKSLSLTLENASVQPGDRSSAKLFVWQKT